MDNKQIPYYNKTHFKKTQKDQQLKKLVFIHWVNMQNNYIPKIINSTQHNLYLPYSEF